MSAPAISTQDRACIAMRKILMAQPGMQMMCYELYELMALQGFCLTAFRKVSQELEIDGYLEKTGWKRDRCFRWNDNPVVVDRCPRVVTCIPAESVRMPGVAHTNAISWFVEHALRTAA